MALKNIRNSGFTIVELLIVIVVIAILATISIVAYNGIQNRAKTSAGNELASQVIKKLEALNAIKGSYTVTGGATSGMTGAELNAEAVLAPAAPEAVLDDPGAVIGSTAAGTHGLSASTANNGNRVSAWACAAGANVWYWDYAESVAVEMNAGQGC